MTTRKRKVTKEANMLVRLSHDLHEKIHKLAEQEDVSVSELVRRVMRREVNKQNKQNKLTFEDVKEFLTPCDGEWINTLDPKEYLEESLKIYDFQELLSYLCLNLDRPDLAEVLGSTKKTEIAEYKKDRKSTRLNSSHRL